MLHCLLLATYSSSLLASLAHLPMWLRCSALPCFPCVQHIRVSLSDAKAGGARASVFEPVAACLARANCMDATNVMLPLAYAVETTKVSEKGSVCTLDCPTPAPAFLCLLLLPSIPHAPKSCL